MQEGDIALLAKTFSFAWTTQEAGLTKWRRYFAEAKQSLRLQFIVEIAKSPIGYGALCLESKYIPFKESGIPEIHDLWVAAESRHMGVGSQLINRLEEEAKKMGYKQIGLGVGLYEDYGPAQRLYFSLGYKPNGKGITYKEQTVIPGNSYPVDDDLVLWLTKAL